MGKKISLYTAQVLVIVCFVALALACKSGGEAVAIPYQVTSFVEGDGGWASVLINQKIEYKLAFDDIMSIVSRHFEIDMISPEAGYIRTKWNTTYIKMSNGMVVKDYRVRVSIKMSKERMKVDINAEAEQLRGGYWIRGFDTQLLETMKKDIAGIVGM